MALFLEITVITKMLNESRINDNLHIPSGVLRVDMVATWINTTSPEEIIAKRFILQIVG